ncbi:cytochrome b [Endozoicomonadaceae bacterium StTr2]
MSGNAVARYSRGFRWVHWVMAVLVITMMLAGQRFNTELPQDERLFSLVGHSSLGLVVVVLMLLRVVMRVSGKAGRPVLALPRLQQLAAYVVQYGIYISLVAVLMTGLATAWHSPLPVEPLKLFNLTRGDAALFEQVRAFHAGSISLLGVLLTLHIVAALWHRYMRRDQVFETMRLGK